MHCFGFVGELQSELGSSGERELRMNHVDTTDLSAHFGSYLVDMTSIRSVFGRVSSVCRPNLLLSLEGTG